MEGVVILVILVVIGLPIVAIIVAARAMRQVDRLEDDLRALESRVSRREDFSPMPRAVDLPPREPPRPPISDIEPELAPDAKPLPLTPLPWFPPTAAKPDEKTEPPVAEPVAAERKAIRLEEQLGTRLPVWIGSIALFLAGAFLVKYTFDKGLLTPTARIILGSAFGLVLLGSGEWLRKRSARIAQGITAAGVADLFACLLAATNLYHLISREMGFGLLAANAALAVALSLRQGPFVALLGLLGGFLTPALIGATEPQPGPLFSYLFILQIGLFVVTRRRKWLPLTALTLAGALLWVGIWLLSNYRSEHSLWIGPFLLGTLASYVATTYRAGPPRDEREKIEHELSLAGAAVGVVMLAVLVGASRFSTPDWVFLGILGAGALVLGRLDSRYELLAWVAAFLGAVLLTFWAVQDEFHVEPRFGATALALGALYAVGGYAALWGARQPARWASLSTLAALGHFLLCYWVLEKPPFGWNWGGLSLILAGIYTLAAVPLIARRARLPSGEAVVAALLAGVTTFASLAAPMELKRQWIAVAWALEVPALALLAAWLHVGALRALAGGLAALIMIRLFQPGILWYPFGENVLFDWILYGYGVPLVAFAVAAWRFHRQGAVRLAEWLEGGAVLLALALVTLRVRHYFHPENLRAELCPLLEWSTYVNSWLMVGIVALLAGTSLSRRVLRRCGEVLDIGGACLAGLILGLFVNPYWRHEPIGVHPIINQLLYIYGLPAVILLLAALSLRRCQRVPSARFAGSAALLFVLLLVTLEVRQWFQGSYLDGERAAYAESYTYSAAWAVLGMLLLALGIVTRGLVLRWASLVVMLLAIGKVFLYDTANLRDLYRVFSLLGLGISLLVLAFLYQRFVFARPSPPTPDVTSPES